MVAQPGLVPRSARRHAAAALSIASLMIVAGCVAKSPGPTADGPGAGSSALASGTSASAGLGFQADGLSLAIPATWRAWDLPASPEIGFAELGLFTVGAGPWCTGPPSPAPSGAHTDPCPLGGPVPDDSMVVEIARLDALGYPGATGPVGWTSQAVAGRTAYILETRESGPPASMRVQWAIARPSPEEGAYVAVARLSGPDLDPLRAELETVLSTATLTPWATPAPSATNGVVHLALGTLSLDYPEPWTFHLLLGPPSIALLTTFPVPAPCCSGLVQPRGTVGFSVSSGTATPFDPATFKPNTTVGGLPADLEEPGPPTGYPDGIWLRWTVPITDSSGTTVIDFGAIIRGPGEAALRAQVEQVIASIRFDASVRAATPSPAP